jgi:hypothetical protein
MPTGSALSSRLPNSITSQLAQASPIFWRAALLSLLLYVATLGLGFLDTRVINGINVWDKPGKFLLSFSIHFLTFAWAFALMPRQERDRPFNRWLAYIFIVVAALEVFYIGFRASRGEASHFNTSSELAGLLYTLMGLGAATLTAITGFYGWRVFRTRHDLPGRAMGTGLMLGAILGTIAGFHLGGQTSHWVGGVQSDAGGLPFFHWSTTGGDLRVAHFFGLHAMQFVPIAAWLWPRPWIVPAAGAVITIITAATLVQAMYGYPLLPL